MASRVVASDAMRRFGLLKTYRARYEGMLNEISTLFGLPYTFSPSPVPWTAGIDFTPEYYDSTGVQACEELVGIQQALGTNSQNRWFSMQLPAGREEGTDFRAIRKLNRLTSVLLSAYGRDGLYKALNGWYRSFDIFGNAVLGVDEQPKANGQFMGYDFVPVPFQQCYFAEGAGGRVWTVYRHTLMTACEAVSYFNDDRDRLPDSVLKAYETEPDTLYFEFVRAVEPKDPSNLSKGFDSIWVCGSRGGSVGFFAGGGSSEGAYTVVRERSLTRFPYVVGRDEVWPGEQYGRGCASRCLATLRLLNHFTMRGNQAVDLGTLPPHFYKAGMQIDENAYVPGAFMPVEDPGSVKPYVVPIQAQMFEFWMDRNMDVVKRAFYNDVMTLGNNPEYMKAGVAAAIDARARLKLIPLFNSMNSDLYFPLIGTTLNILVENMTPEQKQEFLPDDVLRGRGVRIEIVTPIARAQKNLELTEWRQYMQDMALLSNFDQEAPDYVDADKDAPWLADVHGIDMTRLTSPDMVVQIRRARAIQQQRAAQLAALQAGAPAVKDIAQAQAISAGTA